MRRDPLSPAEQTAGRDAENGPDRLVWRRETAMTRPPRKTPAKKRNLAAKALRSPVFRARILPNPNAYKRRQRFNRKPIDNANPDE
jgi:hypothetical protein